MRFTPLGLLAAVFMLAHDVSACMTQISDFGANPGNLSMLLYIPAKVAPNPAIILAMHGCGGNGRQYAQQAGYNPFAEEKGFLVIYPSTTKEYNCWDVATNKSLLHEGGGDSQSLANMIRYTLTRFKADPAKIYSTGTSSGCMMTNIMAATYPDLISATSCYSGVAAGCFAGSPGYSPITSDPRCASGQIVWTPSEWAQIARDMYPGWTGGYPRMLIWHGKADTFVSYLNLKEMLKQWGELLGQGFARNVTDTPLPGYTKMVYGDGTSLLAYSAEGVGHTVPVRPGGDLAWFGIT